MRGYVALIKINLKLAAREKAVLFFNYVFPLIFFFIFGQVSNAYGAAMTQVVSMVLVIGVLGSGLFGAGIRAVAERESNILRRYKVAPITPTPILVASMITGWALYMPSVLITLALAHYRYGMPIPNKLGSLLVMVTLGSFAMRALGLIVASVVNSVQESNILIQMMYLPMLFLSGSTFPLSILPNWAQIVSQFMPATHLFSAMQGIMLRRESMADNTMAGIAMVLTVIVATIISVKLFRWEKDQKIARSAKLWIVAVLLPFFFVGGYQAYSRENLAKNKMYDRELRRSRTRLIRNVRVFVGDGKVIESGAVLIRDGRIAEVYEGSVPDPESLNADALEGTGKTLLPGLIDAHVHLGAPGGVSDANDAGAMKKLMERHLAAYLYSGVIAVKSAGDFTDSVLPLKKTVNTGEKLAAELYVTGPLFTAEGGHGTEYFKNAPAIVKNFATEQFLRTPKTAQEARDQVTALKRLGVDGIKVVLEGGIAGMLFNRMDLEIAKAIADQARAEGLPAVCHTGDARDVADAVALGFTGVEHGSARDRIPDDLFERMAKSRVAYDPTLSVIETVRHLSESRTDLLDRTLVAQVAPKGMIAATRAKLGQRSELKSLPIRVEVATENLLRAHQKGVLLVTGTDSGNMLLIHGPAVHRELQLWVAAGVPPATALQAATHNAAELLRIGDRVGLIRKGFDASVLLVDGNPLQDIASTERISAVFYKGERVDRAGLFEDR